MSRTTLNFLLDFALFVVFLALVWTGIVVRFVFPEPALSQGWRLWQASYFQWLQLHFAILGLFALGILLHLMLHWNWVLGYIAGKLGKKATTWMDDGTKTIVGVAALMASLAVLGVAVVAAASCVVSP